MTPEYVTETEVGITLEELSLVIAEGRANVDALRGKASIGFYALEAAHIIDGFKRAAKNVEPPRVTEVLRNLDENTIWDAQVILSGARAESTSRTQGHRKVAAQILDVKTI